MLFTHVIIKDNGYCRILLAAGDPPGGRSLAPGVLPQPLRADPGIDRHPMGPYEIMDGLLLTRHLERDHVGRQGGHMAIDTIGCQPHLYHGCIGAGMQRCSIVTACTPTGIDLHLPMLVGMRVMTG